MSIGEAATQRTAYSDLSPRQRRRLVVSETARLGATIALVVAVYFVVPLDHGTHLGTLAEVALGVVVLVGIIAFQIRRIVRTDRPIGRAVEALVFSVPLYVLLFATTYFLMARAGQAAFGGPLTRADAMYFSSTVFTTVGFGDVSAKNEAARLVVTLQMWLDLVFLGLVGRILVHAIKFNQQHRSIQAAE